MNNNIKEKIFNAIENNRFKLIEGKRKWYNYIVSIQELSTIRNNKDGFIIDVLDLEGNFLERVNLDIRPVFEFGGIHKKLFLS